jgi:hypothetical protein
MFDHNDHRSVHKTIYTINSAVAYLVKNELNRDACVQTALNYNTHEPKWVIRVRVRDQTYTATVDSKLTDWQELHDLITYLKVVA